MTFKEFEALPEWQAIVEHLGKLGYTAMRAGLDEMKDIGEVRYQRGRLDLIDEVVALPKQLFPDPLVDEIAEMESEKDNFIVTNRRNGELY